MFYSNDEIQAIVNIYKNLSIKNEYTDLCDSIIEMFKTGHDLSDKQIKCLLKQIQLEKKDYSNPEQEQPKKKIKGIVTIELDEIPANCEECLLHVYYPADSETTWAKDYEYCAAGGKCSDGARRPKSCPIKRI